MLQHTNSETGKEILDHFTEYLPKFKKIIPHDYERMLTRILQLEETGHEQRTGKDRSILCDQRRKIGGKKQWEKQQDLWIMTDRMQRRNSKREN